MGFIQKKRVEYIDEASRMKSIYGKYCKSATIKKKRVLFESFHGKDISDSPLAIAKELLNRKDSDKYELYFATVESKEGRHAEFIRAQGLNIKLVYIRSDEYAEVLATSEYLVNNSSFPTYFVKREGQKYLQTWHGTPLKTLGKSMRMGMESMDNIQHNYLQADLIMFPNEFTQEVFMRDYNLNNLYTGEVALCGYPRNSVFCDRGKAEEIRKVLGNENVKTIAYMPTWRGQNNYDVKTESYMDEVNGILSQIDDVLGDDKKLYVNFHPIIQSSVELSDYKHIEPFPAGIDKYDFLNSTDALITDYSSVFFDYSVSGKPIVLFMYDYDEYMHDRGVYFDIKELPFTKTYNIDELCALIKDDAYEKCSYEDSTDYHSRFIKYDTINNTKNLTDYFFDNVNHGIEIQDFSFNRSKKWRIVDARDVKTTDMLNRVMKFINPDADVVVFEKRKFSAVLSKYMYENYRDSYTFIFSSGKSERTFIEDIRNSVSCKLKSELCEREIKQWLGDLSIESLITLKELICAGDVVKISTKGTVTTLTVALYDNIKVEKIDKVVFRLRDKMVDKVYDLNYYVHGRKMVVSADMSIPNFDGIYWDIKVLYDGEGEEDALAFNVKRGMKRKLKLLVRQNRIGDEIVFPHIAMHNQLAFTHREFTKYDGYKTKIKEVLTFVVYKLFGRYFDRKNIWLVFEKYCQMAQDNGYYFFKYCMEELSESEKKHIYYVMKDDSEDYDKVVGYGRNVIKFMSVRHLLYAMAAKIYIGSDSKKHLYIWRGKQNFISGRIGNKEIFFLQHGVTALKKVDGLFGKHGISPMTYFATTSDYEQRIVTENFGYTTQNTPVVGFTRWDVLEDESTEENKLILVMPTWRSWLEGRTAETFKASDYYENYMKLFTNPKLEQVLDEYDGRMVFYIHPKFRDYLGNFVVDSNRIELIPFGSRPLNAIIRECRMLITDYSSVCWDAYYLGKPVMFYQFDYDMYMDIHGSYMDMTTELFGDRFFNSDEVIKGIEENLKNNFRESDRAASMRKDYFKYIDNNNSKRTYEYLKKQGF